MDSNYLGKALVGIAGMAIGATLVTMLRVAAVDGVERARDRHLAELAVGKRAGGTVVAQAELDCGRVAGTH
jgi:hypothetical protein